MSPARRVVVLCPAARRRSESLTAMVSGRAATAEDAGARVAIDGSLNLRI